MAEIPDNQVLCSTGWFSFSKCHQNMFWRKKSKEKRHSTFKLYPRLLPQRNPAIWWRWKLIAGRLMHHNLMLATGSTNLHLPSCLSTSSKKSACGEQTWLGCCIKGEQHIYRQVQKGLLLEEYSAGKCEQRLDRKQWLIPRALVAPGASLLPINDFILKLIVQAIPPSGIILCCHLLPFKAIFELMSNQWQGYLQMA